MKMEATTYLAYLYSIDGVHTLSCTSLKEVGLDYVCEGCSICDMDVAKVRHDLETLILADYNVEEIVDED